MPPEQAPEQASDTPPVGVAYTLREVAELCGISRQTARRYLDEGGRPGRFPNAYRDESGAWRIPIPDLIGAGLSLKARYTGGAGAESKAPEDGPREPSATNAPAATVAGERDYRDELIEALRGEIEYLRAQNAALLARFPMALPARSSPWRLFRKGSPNT